MDRSPAGGEVAAALRPMVRAFWSYPEAVHLLPDERRRRRVLPRYLLSDVRDAHRFSTLLVAPSEGEVVGAAAWIPPEAYPVSLGRQVRQAFDLAPALPWAWRAGREAQRGREANRSHHRSHPPHFYLRAIGIDPDVWGQGLGSSLIRPVLARADDGVVGCFLQTATVDNVGWYERFGFVVAARYRPTPTWPEVWAMWREPVPRSG